MSAYERSLWFACAQFGSWSAAGTLMLLLPPAPSAAVYGITLGMVLFNAASAVLALRLIGTERAKRRAGA